MKLIESIFYLQLFFFFALLIYGMYTRSATVFALAGVFSILTGVALTGEGVSYPTGWDVSGTDDNLMYVSQTYTTYHTWDSAPFNMWHYVLLYGGFVWIIVALVLVARGRMAGDVIAR